MANLKVGIDGRRAEQGGNVVKRTLMGIRQAAGRTDKSLKQTSKTMDRTRKSAFSLGRVMRIAAGAFGIREVFRAANAYQEISNRLRLVTTSGEQLIKVQDKVFDIAQKNRIGFEATAELFQRVARSSETLGLSLDDVAGITDTVAKAITLSGVSAQSANAAIVQLGQGLAAGALRGDELRSVLEQTPRLARAIADGLGVPIGKLRELGQAGKLSAAAVIQSLQDQAGVLEAEFGKTVPTISQAFTVLQNAITRTVGIFTESTGAAGGFADVLIGLAKFIQGPLLQGLLSFGDILGVTFSEIGAIARRTTESFGGLGIDVIAIAGDIGRAILKIPLTITRFINRAIVEIVNGLTILKTRIDSFILETVGKFERFQNALVGTIATIIGDDAVAEQAANARVEIEQRQANERLAIEEKLASDLATLEADRLQLLDDQIAQENRLKDAVQQRIDARLAAAGADTSTPGTGATGGPEIDPKILKDIQKVIEETRSPLESYLARVGELRALFDTGALPVQNYSAALMEANQVYIDAQNDLTGYTDKLAQAEDIFASTRTDAEEYASTQERLNQLLAEGFISQDTFNRALEDAKNKFSGTTDILEEFATQAARNIQTAFADFLFDPFEDGLDGMLFKFAETMKRVAAEALANQILKSLFSFLPGGNFLAAGLSGNQFGGAAFAGVPGLVNENLSAKGEVFVPATNGRVVTKAQAREAISDQAGGPAAAPQVNITNVTDPADAVMAIESTAGSQAILNVIRQNPTAIRRALT